MRCVGLPAHRPCEQHAGDDEREGRRGKRREEELALEVQSQRHGSGLSAGRLLEQLVAELLDGDERVGERRQLLAQPPHVDVHRARAAGVAIAPDVGEQHVARQHAAAVREQVLEQQEFLGGERRPASPPTDTV